MIPESVAGDLSYAKGVVLVDENRYIESKMEIKTLLDRIKYAIDAGASIRFQGERKIDKTRDIRHTNNYTIGYLFPNENPANVLKRELKLLTVQDYLGTVEDSKYPQRGKMHEFGKVYNATDEIYIKLRVVLMGEMGIGQHTTFVMSFHFAEKPFSEERFPYK